MTEDALEALDRMIDEDSRRRQEEMDALRARIAELEKENSWKATKYLLCGDYYSITEEQIDHAWSFRETDPNGCIDAAMSCLGIVVCEECGGVGEFPEAVQAWDVPGAPIPECEKCDGRGWIWSIDGLSTPIDGGDDE